MMATRNTEVNVTKVFGVKPTDFIYEDDQCIVFEELRNPQAPVHFVVVPRKVLQRVSNANAEDERLLGHMLLVSQQLALQRGLARSGYHVMMDEDHKARTLKSLHVFGRSLMHMLWPTGPGAKL